MYVWELPDIGEGVIEGEIVAWKTNEGETVVKDQPICEVMTDKATVELSSPVSGRVMKLHGSPGDVIQVHAPLVEFDGVGDEAPNNGGGSAVAAPVSTPAPAPAPAPAVPAPAPAPGPSSSRTLATPAVRSHARDAGIDIGQVSGSGKGGRVTRQDIDAFVQHPTAVKAPPAMPMLAPMAGDQQVKIIGLRRKIAEKMTESYRTIPHFTYVEEIDATQLVAVRKQLKPVAEQYGAKLTYLAFIMKACSMVFREFPNVNAVMNEQQMELTVRGEHNIGVATDTPSGLYVPVVKNVEQKSILQLALDIVDLTDRTRQNKVSLDELTGATFTITSVGNIGGRFATPIINHPEVAILGVNQIHDRPMVIDGEIVARKMMYLSPSFDHRIIDGAVGARFVAALKRVLEHPESLLLELR